jgi:hypothetical protein
MRNCGLMALAAVIVCFSSAARADALGQIAEILVSSEIFEACHITLPEPAIEQNTRVSGKLDALGKVAWQQFWDELDRNDPSHHEENAKKADHMLADYMAGTSGKGRALVAEKGCPALVPHAQEVLRSYLH